MIAPSKPEIVYPDSDGKPMADNTLQWDWIHLIKTNIEDIFESDPNVFVAGDLLWYPVEGEPGIRFAPDVMVVFGRPKGYRGSYRQWEEGNLPPQVVFEILSPSNTVGEMQEKLLSYCELGVEEYFQFDPQNQELVGWMRHGTIFRRIRQIEKGWTSPRLGIHFKVEDELILIWPNGERFSRSSELRHSRDEARKQAAAERARAEEAIRLAQELQAELARLRATMSGSTTPGGE